MPNTIATTRIVRASAALVLAATALCAQQQQPALRPYLLYHFLSYHIAALKHHSDDFASKGKQSELRNVYKQRAGLTDPEAATLEQIALDCVQEESLLEAKIKAIVDAYRAAHQNGKLAPGEGKHALPPELAALQTQRENAVLRARDRLQQAFGDKEFLRFETFLQTYLGPKVSGGNK